MHGDPLLAPAVIHFVIRPHGGTDIAFDVAGLVDAAAEHACLHIPARTRAPVVIEAEHGRLAIEPGALDLGQHHAEILRAEIVDQAQCAERAPDLIRFVGGEQAVLGRAETAVDLDRCSDVSCTVAIVCRCADAARVEQLAGVRRRGVLEQALVLGEERTLVADEGFGRVEIHHQIIAFDLTEIGIDRGRHLELPIRLPENIGAAIEAAAAIHVVVQARHIRSHRKQ